jgi:hypothetical protein
MKLFTRRYWIRWRSRLKAAKYCIRDDTVAFNLTIRNGGIDLTDPFRPRTFIDGVTIIEGDTAVHAAYLPKMHDGLTL